ncbi:DDB1- and CUL4-associated factor 11, partial [Dufourea novaeangliae]
DIEHDRGLAAVLQYLIRSGQLHIISSDHDDSDEEYIANSQPPRYTSSYLHLHPNTSRLNKSEISLATKQACGYIKNADKRNMSVTSMIQRRAIGPGFSTGERCRISSSFLPNKMHQVAQYNNKAFCGSYSKDGRFFLTASQGK